VSDFALGFTHYRRGEIEEPMLSRARGGFPEILILPPLFAEMNRCRALIADVMAELAALGIGSWLPDLPGTGESDTPLATMGWADWEAAVRAAARTVAYAGGGARPVTLALRGGALLDHAVRADRRWRLAPVAGEALARDLSRARRMARHGADAPSAVDIAPDDDAPLEIAGYEMSSRLWRGLAGAVPVEARATRTARLTGDAETADVMLEGPPLWRRAEPGRSRALARAIAEDVRHWIGRCDVC